MRTELQKLGSGKRHTFLAEFVREGTKSGWKGSVDETILLKNVMLRESGKIVCDHIWFTKGLQWFLDLKAGDVVQFSARVDEYVKGWHGGKAEKYGEDRYEQDWRLSRPTKIKKISKQIIEEEKESNEIMQEQISNYWKDTCGGIR